MQLSYTGIGSRNVPTNTEKIMESLAIELANSGFVLRSGGAAGADAAFEKGCDSVFGEKEIFLPWKEYNNHPSPLYKLSQTAETMARTIWNKTRRIPFDNLRPPIKLLMTRNMHQVFGETLLDPSVFVVCWTPDGCTTWQDRSDRTGGTGQAIAAADFFNVPVFNLQQDNGLYDLAQFIQNNKL